MKRQNFLILICTVATMVANAEIIGHWRFETGAFLTDSSGNGNNLSSVGMTQLAIPGSGNGSTFLNPVPQTGDANTSMAGFGGGIAGFTAVDSTSFGQIAANDAFTLEAFINAGNFADNNSPTAENSRYIVSQYNTAGNNRSFAWQIGTSEGFRVFLGRGDGSFAGTLASSDGLIQKNKDYYVAVSYDAAADVGTFYWQNLTDGGALMSESASLGAPLAGGLGNSTEDLTIGYRVDSSKEWRSDARIDEVRVSDTVLGQAALLVSVPEPSTLMLSVVALAGGLVFLRRKRA